MRPPSRSRALLTATLVAAAAAACDRAITSEPVARANAALAATPVGTHTLRGTVSGRSLERVFGDTLALGLRPVPLAGATVAIALVTRDPTNPDTAKAATSLTPFARLTTRPDGTFEVGNVAAGYYRLDVSPPAGSPLAPARTHSVSFAPGDPFRLEVTLAPSR